MDYDFIVGFTIFNPTGYKTRFRHFNKLENAEFFASNINIKNNCKIYVDYLYYKKLERKIKAKIEELENEKEKYFEKQVIQHEIEVLQSLLEKE